VAAYLDDRLALWCTAVSHCVLHLQYDQLAENTIPISRGTEPDWLARRLCREKPLSLVEWQRQAWTLLPAVWTRPANSKKKNK
jgi:hypothetical protein